MKYRYEDLGDAQFEQLVVVLCQRLLGMGVQPFATGADGGRDAKFVGTAERHPSEANPWVGTVIVQAKHTQSYNTSFSDPEFHSPKAKSTVLAKELPRIRKLRESGELDHYMLFANRRLTAGANDLLSKLIAVECGIPVSSIALCGLERIEAWLKWFPEVAAIADLDPVDSPLTIGPDELAEVVEALARAKETAIQLIENPPALRVSLEEKNEANNMSAAYARALRKKYLSDTQEVQAFLAHPENEALLQLYESVASELQLKIIAKRKDYQTFDEVMEYLAAQLIGRDSTLARHKRLTRMMLFYMYWICDIGIAKDA